jgi:hypothetical protein
VISTANFFKKVLYVQPRVEIFNIETVCGEGLLRVMLARVNSGKVAKVLTHATAFNRTCSEVESTSTSSRIAQVEQELEVFKRFVGAGLLKAILPSANVDEVAKVLTQATAFDRTRIVVMSTRNI